MMCGSTEKPENDDVRQFVRGERVRWVRDADEVGDDVQKGAEGTVDEPEGHASRIPWVELDDGRRVVAKGENLERIEEETPTLAVGTKVRITGSGGDYIHHYLTIGSEATVVEEPRLVSVWPAQVVRVLSESSQIGRAPLRQWVSVHHIEVVEESLEPAVGATVRITGNTNPRHGYPVGTLAVVEKAPDGQRRSYERYAEAWYLREKNGTLHQHVHAEDFEVVEAAKPEEAETPAVPKVGDTVELLEDYYAGLKKGDRGVVVRGTYGYLVETDPLVGVDYGRPGFRNTGTYAHRLRVVPAQIEPLAAALAHIPPRHVLGTWDASEPNVIAGPEGGDLTGYTPFGGITGEAPEGAREATVEVFGEPTTEEVRVQSVNELREGDVVTVAPNAGTPHGELVPVFVRREVLDVPEPAKPAPGTFGTAVVRLDGRRRNGFIDQDGDFRYWDGDQDTFTSRFDDFVSADLVARG